MVRLKDRNRSVPGGLTFLVPQTKWQPYPHSSFRTVVEGLIAHRRANPALVQKYGWATDYDTVANEVDFYNAKRCESHGWLQYIVQDAKIESPKTSARGPQASRSVKNAVAGSEILKDWLGAGGIPVPADIAGKRAWTCTAGAPGGKRCPKNDKGDWTRFFTVPASETIRAMISLRNERSLETPQDKELGVCTACSCPLKLKVWTPPAFVIQHLSPEVEAELPEFCWILKEKAVL